MVAELIPLLFKILETALPNPKEPARPDLVRGNNEKNKPLMSPTRATAFGQVPETGQAKESPAATQTVSHPLPFTDTPGFLPFPLKSPYFQKAAFYIFPRENERGDKPGKEARFVLLLVLKTTSLDTLRLFFHHYPDHLQLTWLTQTQEAKKILEKDFRELETELLKTGYPKVIIKTRQFAETAGYRDPLPFDSNLAGQVPFFELYI